MIPTAVAAAATKASGLMRHRLALVRSFIHPPRSGFDTPGEGTAGVGGDPIEIGERAAHPVAVVVGLVEGGPVRLRHAQLDVAGTGAGCEAAAGEGDLQVG